MAEWGAAVGTISAVVLLLLKMFLSHREKRKGYEDLQQGRTDIAQGNADAVTARVDRLLSEAEASGSGAAGSAGDSSGEGDASTLQRLAALGCCDGETAGKGGSEVDRAI